MPQGSFQSVASPVQQPEIRAAELETKPPDVGLAGGIDEQLRCSVIRELFQHELRASKRVALSSQGVRLEVNPFRFISSRWEIEDLKASIERGKSQGISFRNEPPDDGIDWPPGIEIGASRSIPDELSALELVADPVIAVEPVQSIARMLHEGDIRHAVSVENASDVEFEGRPDNRGLAQSHGMDKTDRQNSRAKAKVRGFCVEHSGKVDLLESSFKQFYEGLE
jgi:hypothetical protein